MTLQVRASSRTTHRTFQCSIPEPIRSWRKYPKHQSIAVEPAVEPLLVHHATDAEYHDQYQTRTACACVLPVPHAGGQNADKASEAVRPVPRQGHGVVHASGAPGDRERPTGRALPQAERLAITAGNRERRRRGAGCSRGAGTRATCYGMRATAGRGVATPRRRAKVHRRPPGAQCCALAQREIVAAAACGQNRELLWRWKMPFSVTHPFCCVARRVPHGGLSGWANLIGWLGS